MATAFFVYVRFQYGLLPLQRYYLPYYLRTETAGLTHPASTYQMIAVSDGKSRTRAASEADVEAGARHNRAARHCLLCSPLMLPSKACGISFASDLKAI